jgi:hypothetical protein
MNISLENFLIFIPLIILAFVIGLVLNKYLLKKEDLSLDNPNLQKNHEDILKNLQEVNEKVNTQLTTLRDKISADLNNVSSGLGTNRGIVESKSNQILSAQEKLLDSLTGSKRFGTTGELLLQNLLEHSGLVKGKQWVWRVKLGKLKNENTALNGGKKAASYTKISTSDESKILAFARAKENNKVIYVGNLSNVNTTFTSSFEGKFTDYMTGEKVNYSKNQKLNFKPWEYKILIAN